MRISELVAELEAVRAKHGDLVVIATWESMEEEIAVYRGQDGETLYIDADGQHYRSSFEHPEDQAERLRATGADRLSPAVGPAEHGNFAARLDELGLVAWGPTPEEATANVRYMAGMRLAGLSSE